jgi:glycosyltransferase involved in cell wall biosynthesis
MAGWTDSEPGGQHQRIVSERVRVVAVFDTAAGDLALFEFVSAEEGIDLVVLFSYVDDTDRGWPSTARFRHRYLGGRTLYSNRQRSTRFVWNVDLWQSLNALRPDVLLVGGYGNLMGLRSINWAVLHHVPWVLYSESWFHGAAPRLWLKRLLLRPIVRRAAGSVTLGSRGAAYLRMLGAHEPIAIIGSNRDLLRVANRSAQTRSTRDPSHPPTIAYVGRLVQVKGVDSLLTAWPQVRAGIPDARLVIVGQGPLAGTVKRAAADVGGIVFRGPMPFEAVANVLGEADVLVLPSRYEPWGQIVPEAMAAGVPVVASDSVGSAEHFIHHGETGWIFPTGDTPALAAALVEACTSELDSMRNRLSEKALHDDVRKAASSIASLIRSAAKR